MTSSRAAQTATILSFASNGALVAALLSRLPDVKVILHISASQLGVMLLAMSLGSVIGLPIAGNIAQLFGTAFTVRIGVAFSLLGMSVTAVTIQPEANIVYPMVGLFLLGIGIGLWDVSQNLEAAFIEQHQNRPIMPWFHAAYSAGTVVGAALSFVAIALGLDLQWQLPTLAIICAITVAFQTRKFLPDAAPVQEQPVVSQAPAKSAWLEPRTLLIGLLVLVAAFTEGSANDWLSLAFVEGYGVPTSVGVAGFAVFLAAMTGGRIIGPSLLAAWGRVRILQVLFAAACVGSLLVGFGGIVGAFIGAAVWGFGASLGFPVGISAAADDPARAAMRISVVATLGFTAFIAGPPLIGIVSDYFGLLNSLVIVGVGSVLALLLAPVTRPLTDETPSA